MFALLHRNVGKLLNIQLRQYAVNKLPEKFNKFSLPVKFDAKLTKKLQLTPVLTASEWHQFRQNLLKFHANDYVNENSVDTILLGYCEGVESIDNQLKNAIHYMDALSEADIEPNLRSCSKLMNMFYRKAMREKISSEEEWQLLQLCRFVDAKLKTKPNREIDRYLILALSVTKEWRDVLKIVDKQKNAESSMAKPPAIVYRTLVTKAFSEDDQQLGWKLLDEISKKNILPDNRIFLAYWDYCRRFKLELGENLDKMMEFIRKNQIIVQKEIVDGLAGLIGDAGQSFGYANIDYSGSCNKCNNSLEAPAELTSDEFVALQQTMKEKMFSLQGMFPKTTSDELNKFISFLTEIPAYDVVIDGYEIASSQKRHVDPLDRADILTCVIEYFSSKNKRVLIIGRKCMEKLWPTRAITLIKKNAEIYFIDDYSKDDPYILYAALLVNATCDMLTLRTPKYDWMAELNEIDQKLLRRWIQRHQFILTGFTKEFRPLVNQPMKYDLLPQKIGQHWHIPYLKDSERICRLSELNETSNEWFCFKVE